MKIKSGFVVRSIAGESVVVALGAASKTFNGIIKLNDTGRFIWDRLAMGCEAEELVEAILAEYDIDRATAEADVKVYIETLKGAGIIE